MRYLTVGEVILLYQRVMAQSGGTVGIHNLNALGSAVTQPRMTFGGSDLYPNLADKAAVLGFVLITNHPFVDGNKRIGHAAMETFLILNGFEMDAAVEEQEQVILAVAAGTMKREAFTDWLTVHIVPCADRAFTPDSGGS
ncbi:MAG: type II toxin-antitoxin system death-on-curing family toxin [Chloroflexaceae bacterium]|nr:type II toxin-antitoxin system death-on-curing family toxin [Chloroflexaceae bacterium]